LQPDGPSRIRSIRVPLLQLPHTAGCLVCGRDSPHGLRLDLHVDPDTAAVRVEFTPRREHIGFEGVVHGGVIATVLDEAMVWCATWAGRRFCVCAELITRFVKEAAVGRALIVETKIESHRSRMITTSAEVKDAATGELVATGTAKYIALPAERNRAFVQTLVEDDATVETARVLKTASQP
jgi:acyl-coenzyme A thioesterase PaaI-like protein